jgi:hypothetical protein
MKQITILLFFLTLGGVSIAQSNLQFNQVVLLTFDSNTSPYLSQLYTVPAGKTWKIENAGCSSSIAIQELNGLRVSHTINSGNSPDNFPIWLPAGTTMKFYNGGSYGCFVSILEFSVTQ